LPGLHSIRLPVPMPESVWNYPRPPRVEPSGKRVRVVVFAQAEKAQEALRAGADEVGGDDLADWLVRQRDRSLTQPGAAADRPELKLIA